MGFFDKVVAVATQAARNIMGSATLREAYLDKKAPTRSGVYELYLGGKLMKIGKAENGLRKRFSDYYRGLEGGTAGIREIDESNRDEIRVSWVCLPSNKCREEEKRRIQEAKKQGEQLPWVHRM